MATTHAYQKMWSAPPPGFMVRQQVDAGLRHRSTDGGVAWMLAAMPWANYCSGPHTLLICDGAHRKGPLCGNDVFKIWMKTNREK